MCAAKYFYRTMTEADCLVAATTGYGYVFPDRFAYAFDAETRERYWSRVLKLNDKACKRMDIDLTGHYFSLAVGRYF